uniref:Trafficking protein particle complex subunit 13 n=1 Tax=Ciona intestinalis TaxID=7719 RepID=F6YPB3_CIOIN|nr:trafficking protein particle complex subunit 13 [Ciona intestinalis]XP_026690326.1 trafficking protein particle complex subunit 13 [Ciona intestinalis]XP_026690327.1 trafficking protein particle complex subunit 13 [Ciona intestinalis]|eukprot:XP_002129801.2 trafficking protein particle complex subunit 13 [Ciona intestinalis]
MDASKEHPLALRVMRLTKPSIITSVPVLNDKSDVLSLNLGYSSKNLTSYGTGETLILPHSFGNIFLGETFVSYLSVNNESGTDVLNVSLMADLQTGSQRITLSNKTPKESLKPGNSLDEVINHEVKELGTHILVCTVSYSRRDGEPKNFRKFFKFQVLKPLDVKTKFYNIECDQVYLETQIQNITPNPICMEKVNLDPAALYTAQSLNTISSNHGEFSCQSYMKPSEVRQYLYWLKLKPSCAKKAFTEAAGVIGKLDIVWKSSLGERGRLQTSQLQRAILGQRDILVQVNQVPENLKVLQPFEISCKVTNYSEHAKQLMVQYENRTNLLWQNVSGYTLNKLPAKESCFITMSLLPTSVGIQSVSGMKVIDMELNRTYDFDDIHQVLVTT